MRVGLVGSEMCIRDSCFTCLCFISLPAVSYLALCEEWEMTSLIQKPPASSPPYLPFPCPTFTNLRAVLWQKMTGLGWHAPTRRGSAERDIMINPRKNQYPVPFCFLAVSSLSFDRFLVAFKGTGSSKFCPGMSPTGKSRASLLLLFKCSVDFIFNLQSSSCVRKHIYNL